MLGKKEYKTRGSCKAPHLLLSVSQDLLSFMNPFHNMAKYRELQRSTPHPLIPFFPIIKKDLTFLYDGNETQVDGLVNFEKLRMLSRQIRTVKSYCQQPIMVRTGGGMWGGGGTGGEGEGNAIKDWEPGKTKGDKD